MQTTNLSIAEILRRAKDKSIAVPQFQRPFVWAESQVKLLTDSISRNYPIGSILLLTRSQSITLQCRSIEAVIRDGFPPDDVIGAIGSAGESLPGDQHYVLDGQQRITSIARVFLNAHPKKTYYFDIFKMVKNYKDESDEWIVTRVRGRHDAERRDRNKLIRSDVVLNQSRADIFVSEYIEDSGDFPEFADDKAAARLAAATVKGVFERLRNYQVPVVTIERDAKIESVCRIFETINSTGTRLTTYDLAVARFYPEPDLRSMWDAALDKHNLLRKFDADGERVLQVISLIYSYRERKYSEVTRGALLDLTRETIDKEWGMAASALADAYEWARRNGARPPLIPSHGLLPAIAAANALHSESSRESGKHDNLPRNCEAVMQRWYFCKILQQGARQATNYKISRDFKEISEFYFHGINPQFDQIHIGVHDIVRLYRSTDVRYRGLQSLLMRSIDTDICTGKPFGDDPVEENHIFPKSMVRERGKALADSIANKIPLLKTTNRTLGDVQPYEYFAKYRQTHISSGTMGQFKQTIRICLIPGNPDDENWHEQFKIERFEEFLENRARLIIEQLRLIVGESLIDKPSPNDLVDADE